MTQTVSEQKRAQQWAEAFTTEAEAGELPFSFVCDGTKSTELFRDWQCRRCPSTANADSLVETVTFTDSATGLAVRAEINVHTDFPAVEWVLHFVNTGSAETPLIEAVQALDARLPLGEHGHCLIRHSKGARCSVEDFAPVTRELRPRGNLRLQPGGGRSSSEVLPFFNVDLGQEGVMLAVGWTGEWAAEFARGEDASVRLRAGMAQTHLRLHPGEAIRTPRVLLLFWEGAPLRGHNLLRRFLLKHHRPHPGGAPLVPPLCSGNWGGTSAEVHLDNVRKIVEHDLPFECYWIDAEWFGGPGHWMEHAVLAKVRNTPKLLHKFDASACTAVCWVLTTRPRVKFCELPLRCIPNLREYGNWKPREDLYPNGFRPISDLLHQSGRQFLLWVEFERVAPNTPWAREHADWLLDVPADRTVSWADYGDHLSPAEWVAMESKRNKLGPGDKLLDLGNPDARRFLTDYLSKMIADFGLDCLRQDSNIAHLEYWRNADAPDRQGLTEIRYVEGQYALWDELLTRHPNLFLDNCASGGRRIDLESISRATPLWRTDYTASVSISSATTTRSPSTPKPKTPGWPTNSTGPNRATASSLC